MSRFIFSSRNPDGSTSLYSTDGTAAGTIDLQAARYGFAPSTFSAPDFIDIGSNVLFIGSGMNSAANLSVIYRSDGTAIGTSEIIVAGTGGSLTPVGLWEVGTTAITSGATATGFQGLYASADGVNFGAIAGGVGVDPGGITVSNGIGYFGAINNGGSSIGLWRTDGTSAGTTSISSLPVDPSGFATAGATTVFTAESFPGSATSLWVTNGTAEGTAQLQVPSLASVYAEFSLVSIGSRVLFLTSIAPDASDYATLWSTDGTVAGTTQISTSTGISLSQSGVLAGLGKAVFTVGTSLYITDGTAVGTVQIPSPAQQIQQAVTLGNEVIYLGTVNGAVSLFSYDANSASTTSIVLPSVDLSSASLSVVGQQVIFNAIDPSNVEAFYATDGTQAGTTELALPSSVTLNPTNPPLIAVLPTTLTPMPPLPPTPPGPIVLPGGDQNYSAAAGSTVLAGSGNDTVTATAGQVTVVGSSGSLAFIGGTGPSSVTGGGGSSTIFGGSGGGYFNGGRGGFNVLVSEGASGANTSLTGGGAGDQIFGSGNGNDVLTAGAGRESILGGSGHTTIQGGTTASVIFTGGGSTAVFGGTSGGDTIVGGSGSLNVSARQGDAIFGGGGVLNVTGSKAGADSIVGGTGALLVTGQGANMLVVAGTSTSDIQVGNGASLIFAGSGTNSVIGGTGSLQVLLGSGATSVTEGGGAATFQVQKGDSGGTDVINGFKTSTDRINLYGYQASDIHVTSGGGSSLISLSDGTKIEIVGVTNLGHSLVS